MQGGYKMCTVINTSIPESDLHLISPFKIIPKSSIKLGHEKKGNDNQLKNLLIVKQILPASTLEERTVWRICILM